MAAKLKMVVNNEETPVEKTNPSDPKDNWLSRMPEHTVFLCRKKYETGFALACIEVLAQWTRSAHLTQEGIADFWVSTELFSSQNELYEVLHQPSNKDHEHDQRNRTDQAGRLDPPPEPP